MLSRLLYFTQDEWNEIYNFFIATREVFEYCYSNSEEYKTFIDTLPQKRRNQIFKSHKNRSKILINYNMLNVIINSKEFKLLFYRLDDILFLNNVKWN